MSEIISQPEGPLISGPLIEAGGHNRIVSIQNFPSKLWAYAVADGQAQTEEIKSVVAQEDSSNSAQPSPAQQVILP